MQYRSIKFHIYRASPTITSIDISLPSKQELHNIHMTFTGSYMKRGTTIEINTIDIDPFVKQILNAFNISSTSHEEELHSGVEVIGDGELRMARTFRTPSNRIERRLPAEAEPHIDTARIVRRLARELAAERPAKRYR